MRGKSSNIIAIFKIILFIFDSNEVNAVNAFEKLTVTGDGSNNSGVWGRSLQLPVANGGLRRSHQHCGNFSRFFFLKIKHFSPYFDLNFCLKTCFK